MGFIVNGLVIDEKIGVTREGKEVGGIAKGGKIAHEALPEDVGILPTSIKILGSTLLSIKRSASKQLETTILPDDATDKSVVWQSGDPSIVTIDQTGLIKAIKNGTTIINARTVNNISAKITVMVGA